MLTATQLAPGADPLTGARPLRDAWLWRTLPASARRVGARGGSLAQTLRAAGFDVCDPEEPNLDAIVLDPGAEIPPAGFWTRQDTPLVALGIRGGSDTVHERAPRAVRAAQLARAALGAAGVRGEERRAARSAEAAGRAVSVLATSDRSRPYVIGNGGLRRPQEGSIVVGWAGAVTPSAFDEAMAVALRAADDGNGVAEPVIQVVESGKLICRTLDPAGMPQTIVRVAAGSAGDLIASATAAVTALAAPGVPETVRSVLPRMVSAGRAGQAAYTVEAWAPGPHPTALDPGLWEACRAFLEDLRAIPVESAPDPHGALAADQELLEQVLPADARRRLAAVRRLLDAELSGVPLGWAHGDFWPDNLIVRDGRLTAVLDWDTASAHELPGLDALDLLGFGAPRSRWSTFGPRFVDAILPLAREQDPRLVDHCRSVGAPADRQGLEALAWAWWLRRTALTVREYPDRRSRPAWLHENLTQPLALAPSR